MSGLVYSEWVRPVMTGYRFVCCDCDRVHALDFRVGADGLIEFRAARDEEATDLARAGQFETKNHFETVGHAAHKERGGQVELGGQLSKPSSGPSDSTAS